MENQSKESTSNDSKSSQPPPSSSPEKQKILPRILIVDDEVNLGQMMQDILEAYDFKTAFAETSEIALKLMPDFKPEVALVDFRLGDITGIEVAQLLKKIDEDLPVIIMTAYPSLDLAVKAIQSDIYDFLSKPIDKTYLLRSINKAIEKRTLSRENKQLIASLKESNTKLDRLNNLKTKFLSVVTHDLRTPLTSIKGYAEVLKTTPAIDPESKERCFSAIEKSSEHMGNLISNLMDMVSIEAGKLRVEKSAIDFIKLCRELKETFASVSSSKNIALKWELPEGEVMVMGDSNRLIQVLSNLISNAFKHVPEKSRILVRVSKKEPMVLSEVIDNGEGISPENQTRIFEQFFQVESSPTRRQGLGLGLNITKEIVSSHEGEIGVHSEGLGKGSTFWFTIPLLKES